MAYSHSTQLIIDNGKWITSDPIIFNFPLSILNCFYFAFASLRSRNGEALKTAEKLQGGGHANACGATLPKSVRTIPDAIIYLRQVLNPVLKKETALNNLESLFAAIELK